jgi:hypothetical protein
VNNELKAALEAAVEAAYFAFQYGNAGFVDIFWQRIDALAALDPRWSSETIDTNERFWAYLDSIGMTWDPMRGLEPKEVKPENTD